MRFKKVVHVVCDDAAIINQLTALLETYDIRVHGFPDAESFLREECAHLPADACLITALDLPGMSGLSLVRQLREQNACLPIILLTDTVDRDVNLQALQLGTTDVIDKPLVKAFLANQSAPFIADTTQRPASSSADIPLANGKEITFRAISPDDAGIEQAFVQGLSNASKHLRFFSAMKQLSPKLLEQFTHPSFPGNYALIATTSDGDSECQIGVARYLPTETDGVAEFAVVVADAWQGLGIASRLMHGIICVAAVAGVETLEGIILRDNPRMLKLARYLGFRTVPDNNDPATVRVSRNLRCPLAPQ